MKGENEVVERWQVRVRGIVQGVGFRPFVYRLAVELGLGGQVKNDSEGVLIEAEGEPLFLRAFLARLEKEAPAAAVLCGVETVKLPCRGENGFFIVPSAGGPADTLISPDLAICAQCRADIGEKGGRRYGYAFTSCTECGPRYSIVQAAPYDRERTSMAGFVLCEECAAEYHDPEDRRFHAEPDACPKCGPHIWLETADGRRTDGWREGVRQVIASGGTVAIKGIGGFHLAADAMNEKAVARLRQRKRRERKPFAVMAGSLGRARELAELSPQAERLLTSPQAPIVLVPARRGQIAPSVAPDNAFIGLMLPYAPQQVLLMEAGDAWVMTSGNRSGEPQLADNDEAAEKLAGIADAFLFHDREIVNPLDDSVVQPLAAGTAILRRGRGLAPAPVALPSDGPVVLAGGGELKSAFCLAKGRQAFLSEHIGDLKNEAVYSRFREKAARYGQLFGAVPAAFAVDMHPDYLSGRYLRELAAAAGVPCVEVQHHHAHIAAVLAEHGGEGEVIGLAFDGTGWGTDGTVWGGELLRAGLKGYTRLARFRPLPLPGGGRAAEEPWRQALWVLDGVYGEKTAERRPDFADRLENGGRLLLQAVKSGLNAPLSSSVGRLFDTAAALLGLCFVNSYEGEAAAALEQAARRRTGGGEPLEYQISSAGGMIEIDLLPGLRELALLFDGSNAPELAWRFHLTVAVAAAQVTAQLAGETGLGRVAISGGCFQNGLLVSLLEERLAGLRVLRNASVPPNDGGLAYGQAAVARAVLQERGWENVSGISSGDN